jgi:hypothetical protein
VKAGALGAAVVLAFARAAAAQPVANCSTPNDPQGRQWTLERPATGAPDAPWRVIFRSRALDQRQTELRVPRTEPAMTADSVTLTFTSANGGLNVDWRATTGASTIDIYVNFGLEVNVDADLDPAVEAMNTQGPIAVVCTLSQEALGIRLRSEPTRGASDFAKAPSDRRSFSGGWSARQAPATLLSEWVIGAGAAWGIRIFHSTGDRWYAVQTVSWGRELTSDVGPGVLRGRFVWAVEAMPLFAQTHPTDAYGVGIAPVLWRWNFVPRPRWSAYGELAMGGLWTSSPIPEQTRRGNFTAHWGGGVRLKVSGERSVVLAYRLQHISNGNQLLTNPGVNSHVLFVGWSTRRARS